MMQAGIFTTHSGSERLSIMPLSCFAQAGALLVVLDGRCTRPGKLHS
jgi:hypothetical protein